MDQADLSLYWVPYVISNLVALLILFMAIKRPSWARWGYIVLFAWASWANGTTSLHTPEVYLDYADLTFLPVYRDIILGGFSEHIGSYVGLIAVCQALIAIGLLVGGVLARIAAWGAIVFLLAILPLGIGSAFPCSLVFAIGSYVLLRNGMPSFAWRSRSRSEIA